MLCAPSWIRSGRFDVTADLRELSAQWIVIRTRKTRNSRHLAQYLRTGGLVTPEIANLIADILAGKLAVKYRERRVKDVVKAHDVRFSVEFFRDFVMERDRGEVSDLLKLAKYRGRYPESKSEITRAANCLAAFTFGLTVSEMDAIRFPRARSKSREI